jgi:hypothetical protein
MNSALNKLISVLTPNVRSVQFAEVLAPEEPAPATFLVKRRRSPVDSIVFINDSDTFTIELVKMKLNNMYKSSFFDICVIRDSAKALKVNTHFSADVQEKLALLHCVHWSAMTTPIRDLIPAMISHVFTEGVVEWDPSRRVAQE